MKNRVQGSEGSGVQEMQSRRLIPLFRTGTLEPSDTGTLSAVYSLDPLDPWTLEPLMGGGPQ